MLLLGRVELWLPDTAVFQFVGQELLLDEVAGVVVGVLVLLAVAQLLHQLGGRIAQVQGDGEVARFAYQFQGIVDGHIG